VFALATVDAVLSGVVWRNVYRRYDIVQGISTEAWIYAAGYAGLLVPAQLGRLIRPEASARLGARPFALCVRAEAAAMLLNLIAVGGLLTGLVAYALAPLLALPVLAIAVACALYMVSRVASWLLPDGGLPERFWWRASTAGLIAVQMLAWLAHGLGLHVVLVQSMPDVSVWEPVLFSTLAALGGAASGIPGGIGVSEWLLGGSLTLLHVPDAELAVSIAVFRAASQWIWLPIGWLALAVVRRRAVRVETERA
jgi:uncharacterized membrane protein YbhN (UPF0104 family)